MMNTKDVVLYLLQVEPKTRGNDMYLYYRVLQELGMPTNLKDLAEYTTVNMFETVSRIRRKAQQTNPSLLPVKHVTKKRKQREEYFKDLSRGL